MSIQDLPEAWTEDVKLLVKPEAVEKVRRTVRNQLQFLIKWRDLPSFENTCEEYDVILSQFPNFHLEDKVKFIGEGIDGPGWCNYQLKDLQEKRNQS